MKIEFVSIHIKRSPQAMPVSVAMLCAKLDSVKDFKETIETSFSDFYLGDSAEKIASDIIEKNPDIIGFSVYVWNRDLAVETAIKIKSVLPDIVLFAGGAEATSSPLSLLKSVPFDFVVKGEGELVLTEAVSRLTEGETVEGIKGILTSGAVLDDGVSQPVMDLDQLPSPFLTGKIDLKNYEGVLWELSRGCPFKCDFCFESRGIAKVRNFSLDRIEKELELFEENGVSQIFVLDPTFNKNKERAKKILQMIKEKAPAIHFTFEVRTEFIDKDMAELFASVNCNLQIGLQSADKDVLACVNRNFDKKSFREKIGILNRAGAVFGLDLIYGLPTDTIAGFRQSLDYAVSLQPNNLDIFPLSVLPGTVLFDKAPSFGIKHLENSPYTVIETPDFSKKDLKEASVLSQACDIFYNQGKAVGWLFMILETVNILPSSFFEGFSRKLENQNSKTCLSANKIKDLQLEYTKELFAEHGKKNLFPPMADIIKLNSSLNQSLVIGPSNTGKNLKIDLTSIPKLMPATLFETLTYDFDDLQNIGELIFAEFIKHFSPSKCDIVTYNYCGEARVLPLDLYWIKLLKAMNGKKNLGQILSFLGYKLNVEVKEFIEYVIEEEIIKIK